MLFWIGVVLVSRECFNGEGGGAKRGGMSGVGTWARV